MNQYNNTTNSRNFKQLNYEKRFMIQTLLNKGFSQAKIAEYVGCNQSTISREINGCSFKKKTATYEAILEENPDFLYIYNSLKTLIA